MAALSELLGHLSDNANVRGCQFERICKWYLLHDPSYKGQLKRVWLWDGWSGRWGSDAGIDLVAETNEGKLWAIQAKAYDPKYRITKHDVDTFLSESARPQFHYRLLIATTNLIGKKALRTLQEQEKPAGYKLLSDLRKAPVEWPRSPKALRAPKPQPKKPWPHVREAIAATAAGLQDTDRGQLIMACGTGKTLAGLWISEKLDATRTLVLLPSLSLLAQTLREWTANAREPFAILAVCSDETVTGGGDNWVSHTSDLGMPVTTDAAEIAAFLRRRGSRVVFGTYHSSPRVAEAFAAGRTPHFDLAIADEAHRVAGATSSDFSTILDGEAIRARKRLFMTATPRFFTGRLRKAAAESDYEIASMDDEAHFGPVLHRLTFGEAIERDLLSDYQVLIVGVDDPTYRDYAERGTFVTRDGKEITDARTLASHIAVAKATRKHGLRRTITFHSRISWARSFSQDFAEVVAWLPKKDRPSGDLVCDFVSGEMPSGHRDSRLDRLRYLDADERGFLSNARCLSEGVDVPTLDGVAFIDPRRSQVDIVQAVGRAIRKAEDKKLGTIILPVFIESTEDPEAVLSTSAFKHVWDVLKALRAHDNDLADQLDSLRRGMGMRGTGRISLRKITFDVPATVGPDFQRAFKTRLVEASTESWEFWFGLLRRYGEREGNQLVAADHVEDGYHLGRWVSAQRHKRVKGSLSKERCDKLDALPDWEWDADAARWEQGLDRLLQYVGREGHARVPAKHRENGFRLGQWVSVQRAAFRRGNLETGRSDRLGRIQGWVWDARSAKWEEALDALREFVRREGHANVPAKHTEAGFRLGNWVVAQRRKHSTGRLSQERREQLEAVSGWVWDAVSSQWETGYRYLLQFLEREGHASVPQAHREGEYPLGSWVSTRRGEYRKGKLAKERADRLKALPGWVWDAREG